LMNLKCFKRRFTCLQLPLCLQGWWLSGSKGGTHLWQFGMRIDFLRLASLIRSSRIGSIGQHGGHMLVILLALIFFIRFFLYKTTSSFSYIPCLHMLR
jgi:hypothetical protein